MFRISIVCLLALLAGAATSSDETDPMEGLNRTFFTVNDTLDSYFLKPVAKGYQAVMPDVAEKGVSNFFSNLNELTNIANDLLQGKFRQAGNDGGRFLINSTIGVGGLFDVAQRMGLDKSEGEDFGQTLASWGVDSGPYLMLPLVGPSTLRDAPSRVVDSFFNPVREVDHVSTRNSIRATDVVQQRAALLKLEEAIAGDKYLFIRDVYLQRREYLVNDGAIEDDFGDLDDY